ncbi:MAG: TGS domain-containing protein [Thiotrichaceae bacterium]
MKYHYHQLKMESGFYLPSFPPHVKELVAILYNGDKTLTEAADQFTINKKERINLLPETINLLEEWEHLKNKRARKCEGSNKLVFFRDQLAQLIEPRAIPFLVFDYLSKWDPDGRISKWSKNFKSQTCQLPNLNKYSPVQLPTKTYQKYSGEYKNELEYTRFVAAACAEYCGLWDERNALQDIAFISDEYELAKKIVTQCQDPLIKKHSQKSLDQIKEILSSDKNANFISDIEWEWRHVASMRRKLGDIKPKYMNANLWRIGFVTVFCKTIENCYQLLGHLHTHESISSLNEQFNDFVGNPPPSGYKAIHTIVDVKENKSRNRIYVRFIVRNEHSLEIWRNILLKRGKRTRGIDEKKTIRVYTPTGDFRDLPLGSTVLDFTAHLQDKLVGKVDYATINNSKKLTLLDKLNDGDNVNLMIENEYKLLPEGWEKAISGKSKHIRKRLKYNLSIHFKHLAHQRLQKKLPQYKNLVADVRELVLQAVVDESNTTIFNANSLTHQEDFFDTKRWLIELGIKEEKENGTYQNYPFYSQVDQYKERVFIRSLKGWIDSTTRFPKADIINKKIRKNKFNISICPICNPTRHCDRVIKANDDNLVFHRKDSKCGQGGEIIETTLRATKGQYFVIEINGEINGERGILSQILNILHGVGVRVAEVVGMHLGLDWVVIRIEVGLVSSHMIAMIQNKIKLLEDVQRVLGPNDPKTPILENALPPRIDTHMKSAMVPAPFTCGSVVKHDHDFYNRFEELAELQRSFDYQTRSMFLGGRVFICGPLKTGKTSLAYKFLRSLNQLDHVVPLIVYYQAQYNDQWSDVEAKLVKGLKANIQEQYHSNREFFHGPKLKHASLEDLLEVSGNRTRSGKPIVSVLIIDEALIPFRHAHDAAAAGDLTELENIKQFSSVIHNKPGTLLVWVGPNAPVNALHIDLKNTLRACEEINVKPFSKQHTQELLHVSKLQWKYRINISRHITNHLWKITNGNPFWLNHLGRKMWEHASQKTILGEMVEFTAKDMRAAREEILSNDVLFSDRIYPEGYYRKGGASSSLVDSILKLLSTRRNSQGKHWLKTWISPDDVLDIMKTNALENNVTTKMVLDVFNDLVAMGGFEKNNNCIRLSAQLLADWLINNHLID